MKHKVRISETRSKIVEIEARTRTEAVDIAMKHYYDCEYVIDSNDMYEITFTNEEDTEK